MLSVLQILQGTKELLIRDGWIKDMAVREKAHCLSGALWHVGHDCQHHQLSNGMTVCDASFVFSDTNTSHALRLLYDVIVRHGYPESLPTFNDCITVTFNEVLAILDEAIELARQLEPEPNPIEINERELALV